MSEERNEEIEREAASLIAGEDPGDETELVVDYSLQDAVDEAFKTADPFAGRLAEAKADTDRANSEDHILQFFVHEHLPPHLQNISRPFQILATEVIMKRPRNPERTVALRKLLEAKDAAVRAELAKRSSNG